MKTEDAHVSARPEPMSSIWSAGDDAAVASLVRDEPNRFRVHSSVYTDQHLFELEMVRIFGNSWVYVTHEAMIPDPGTYVTTVIGTQPVIVSRSENNQIHVLLNRCAHRGSVVCREERGCSSTFRCPYHGWVYANDGRLLGAAQRSGYPDDFHEWDLRLTPVPAVGSYRGFVFANMNPAAEPLEDRLRGVARYIDLWCDRSPTGRVGLPEGAHRYQYPGNWKLQAENGIDGYHGNYVHESFALLLEQSGERLAVDITKTRNAVGSRNFAKGLRRGDGLLEREAGMLGTFDFNRYPGYRHQLANTYGADRADDILAQRNIFIFPNLYLFESHIRVVRPVAFDRTYVDVLPTYLQDAGDELNAARLHEHERFFGPASFGAPDDIEIFVCIQSGAAATADPWMEFSRGMHRESINELGEVVGHSTDETPQRAQYREWLRLMSAADAPAAADNVHCEEPR